MLLMTTVSVAVVPAAEPNTATITTSGLRNANVRELWQNGREAQLASDWNRAIDMFSRLLEIEPKHIDAIVALGFSYFKKGDLDEAEKLYQRALKIDNRQVGAGFGWGQIEMARKNWQKSTEIFRDVLRLAPDFQPVAARHNLALSLFSLKRYQEAEAVYEELLQQPASTLSPELLVNALDNEIAVEHYQRAVQWGREGTRLFPDSALLWDRLAWSLRRIDEVRFSDEAYNRAEAMVYGSTMPHHETVLTLPFRGAWRVIQGNNGQSTHRGLGARFAWDFQAMPSSMMDAESSGSSTTEVGKNEVVSSTDEKSAPDGRPRRWHRENKDFASFGQEVLAPAPGRVVALQDGTPDNEPFHRNPSPQSGNYILIEHAPGEFSSLGHLQNGSINVKVGDMVERGQVIARCGNSGNTALPHLHFSFIGSYKGIRISMPSQFSNYRTGPIPPRKELSADVDIHASMSTPVITAAGIPIEGTIVENNTPESVASAEVAPADAVTAKHGQK